MWHTRNKSKLCPSLWLHTTTKWEERIVKRVLIQHPNQQTWAESWVEIETAGITGVALLGIFGLGVYAFVAYEWKSNFFCESITCLSVCWRFIIRWDLESHGIYMMSQLTTLLYFEAFDGDSPKNRLRVRSTLMSALSKSLNAFGILVDLRNCPVACNDAGILPYYHIKYWTQQSAYNCCN